MEFEDIPAEVRWEIAAKSSMALSMGYGMALRQILDEETVSKIEEAIMSEAGKEIKTIADALGLPAENAMEIDDAYGIVGMIQMGKMKYETLEVSKDRVIQRITSCPILDIHKEKNIPIITMPQLCQIYGKSAVEELNPKYTQKFTKRMCEGEGYCEYAINLK